MSTQTGEDLVKHLVYHYSKNHGISSACPGCGESCSTVGLTRLAYTFEICSCEHFEYEHLVETIWHIECLNEAAPQKAALTLLRDTLWLLRQRKGRASGRLADRIERYLNRPEKTSIE